MKFQIWPSQFYCVEDLEEEDVCLSVQAKVKYFIEDIRWPFTYALILQHPTIDFNHPPIFDEPYFEDEKHEIFQLVENFEKKIICPQYQL